MSFEEIDRKIKGEELSRLFSVTYIENKKIIL